MRGRLDDALDRLARRDMLRRRTESQATGTPPEVTELVEAVATIVARHPELGITMGVEGVGEPVLLHFVVEDGVVRVSADHRVATADNGGQRRADFDIDGDAIDDPLGDIADPLGDGAGSYGAGAARRSDRPSIQEYERAADLDDLDCGDGLDCDVDGYDPGDGVIGGRSTAAPPSSLAATLPPPSVPPQMPAPVPFKVEPEATEFAAKRLAALLREHPSLLHPEHPA